MATHDAPHILLVDDDTELVGLLNFYLRSDGFRVTVAHDGESGVQAAFATPVPDIAIIDVMMPGISGIEALRRIRARSAMPVLMLTARGDDESKILGLELGADDYVPKPCTPRELSARIRAILRRTLGGSEAPPGERIACGSAISCCKPPSEKFPGQAGPTALTNAEFNFLEVLIQRAGQVVSKEFLSEQALGRPRISATTAASMFTA